MGLLRVLGRKTAATRRKGRRCWASAAVGELSSLSWGTAIERGQSK
ncbi:hypothetical protein CCACVL1_16020 [Corchorus capsularis]|uniref:Uncharacterized protein n=1 Tax=Corchorus capsularis TaxID=210143 RepID=A0A1R3HZS0_COCAP|nr:hypothetical protein CCACVL1_16020 [Corchorus capsularis]